MCVLFVCRLDGSRGGRAARDDDSMASSKLGGREQSRADCSRRKNGSGRAGLGWALGHGGGAEREAASLQGLQAGVLNRSPQVCPGGVKATRPSLESAAQVGPGRLGCGLWLWGWAVSEFRARDQLKLWAAAARRSAPPCAAVRAVAYHRRQPRLPQARPRTPAARPLRPPRYPTLPPSAPSPSDSLYSAPASPASSPAAPRSALAERAKGREPSGRQLPRNMHTVLPAEHCAAHSEMSSKPPASSLQPERCTARRNLRAHGASRSRSR